MITLTGRVSLAWHCLPESALGMIRDKEVGCTMECKIKNDIGTIFITEDVML